MYIRSLDKNYREPYRGKTVPTSFSLSPLHSDVNHETPINEQQYRIPRTQQCRHDQTMSRNALLPSSVCLRVCLCVRDRTDLIWKSFEMNSISTLAIVVSTSSRHCTKNQARYKRLRTCTDTHTHTRTLSFSLSFHLRSTQTAGLVDRRSSYTLYTPVPTGKI